MAPNHTLALLLTCTAEASRQLETGRHVGPLLGVHDRAAARRLQASLHDVPDGEQGACRSFVSITHAVVLLQGGSWMAAPHSPWNVREGQQLAFACMCWPAAASVIDTGQACRLP